MADRRLRENEYTKTAMRAGRSHSDPLRALEPISDEGRTSFHLPSISSDITSLSDTHLHPALRQNAVESTHKKSGLAERKFETRDARLSRARCNLINDEMSAMLRQVHDLERRASKIKKVLAEHHREIQAREINIAQRESWLRARENSIRQRERRARRRELQMEDLESELVDATGSTTANRQRASFLTSGPAVRQLLENSRSRPVVFDDDLPTRPETADPEMSTPEGTGETTYRFAASSDHNSATLNYVNQSSSGSSSPPRSEPGTNSKPALSKGAGKSIATMLSSFAARKASRPPQSTITTRETQSSVLPENQTSFWKSSRDAAGAYLKSMFGRNSSGRQATKQRRKLIKQSDGRLESIRKQKRNETRAHVGL